MAGLIAEMAILLCFYVVFFTQVFRVLYLYMVLLARSFWSSMATDSRHVPSSCIFRRRIADQEQELSELLEALSINGGSELLTQLTEKVLKNFEDYMENRREQAKSDVSEFFAPKWCTSFENSLLWIAGCRPSIFFRLIYSLSGLDIETNLPEIVSNLSHKQLVQINSLHMKTIQEEEKLTTQVAIIQEKIADRTITMNVKKLDKAGDINEEIKMELAELDREMVGVFEEADKLRLKTLKQVLPIMTPLQGAEFLAASKKLYLSVHRWGKQKDGMQKETNKQSTV